MTIESFVQTFFSFQYMWRPHLFTRIIIKINHTSFYTKKCISRNPLQKKMINTSQVEIGVANKRDNILSHQTRSVLEAACSHYSFVS